MIPGSGSSPGGGHGNPLQCSLFLFSFFLKLINFLVLVFNWRVIALQNFVVFCQTSTWIRITWTEEPGGLQAHGVTSSRTQLNWLSRHAPHAWYFRVLPPRELGLSFKEKIQVFVFVFFFKGFILKQFQTYRNISRLVHRNCAYSHKSPIQVSSRTSFMASCPGFHVPFTCQASVVSSSLQ